MDNESISLINLAIDASTGEISLSGYFWYAFIAIGLIALIYLFFRGKYIKKSQVFEFNIAGQKYSYTLERDYSNVEIAHRIYVELVTRKAAIPFDEENDIVEEVYNSWYSLFGIIREEIKRISGQALLKDNKSLPLIELTTAILNKGLRPHLTKYQGRFRKWCGLANSPAEGSPQECQELYPDYETLVADLKTVNNLLVEYAEQLKTFIYE
ncbi:MAG: hypothetical protein AB7D39_14985 [Pseudodesulfovibrio sp.]|uniref:hypothetical protein n=1 Tax=Pseudodesulfovibrio sp. TaxID=2035812 RepID=UPI003D140292